MITARPPAGVTETPVKVSVAIACSSALALLVGLTGCAGDRHTQSTGPSVDDHRTVDRGDGQSTDQSIEDKRTAERIREALAAASEYKFAGVQVAAGNGVIQLSGLVNTSAQRNSAGEVASKVVGVKSVENHLIVTN